MPTTDTATERALVRSLFRKLRSKGMFARMGYCGTEDDVTQELRLDGVRPGRAVVYVVKEDMEEAFDGERLSRGLDLHFGTLPPTGDFGDPLNPARDLTQDRMTGQQVMELAQEVWGSVWWNHDAFVCVMLKAAGE